MAGPDLTDEQLAAVHAPPAPLVITGGFGTGKSAALAARAEHLERAGRSVLRLHARSLVAFCAGVLARNGRPARVLTDGEQHERVASLLASSMRDEWHVLGGEVGDPAFATELARTVRLYQASFLAEEELLVHADAARELDVWSDLAAFAERYLSSLRDDGAVDSAGALVAASVALRDAEIRESERSRFDDVIVDDYQLADFGSARLLAQLVGRDGSITVAGNPAAFLGDGTLRTPRHLDMFTRRYTNATAVELSTRCRRPAPPALRIVDGDDELVAVARDAVRGRTSNAVVTRDEVAQTIGEEWSAVAVVGATDGRWPCARMPHRWFDPFLFGGPDVPSDNERDGRWLEEERRRFTIACSRSTDFTIVVATPPVSRFIADIVDP